ncbi:Protein PCAF-1 [Aphelenchoides avenae]|nr:Protein PCAF-1 [Aphelenchus avenae]
MSKRLCSKPLGFDDIKNSLERHTGYEAGKQLLVDLMNRGDIAATFVKLSLKCKLMKGRIEVPVRSVHCPPHFECFDLRNYLSYEAKNSLTFDAPSSKKSQRPVWACPVCGERAQAEDLRIDDYFAHILQSMPASVDEVKLLPDGSFEEVSAPVPEVTIDDEHPFEPQPEHDNEPLGPSHSVDELLKQSKTFQGTLQSFRTKKDLLDKVQTFLEDERETLGALRKNLISTNQDDVATCSMAAKKLCLSDARAAQAPKELSRNERDKAYRAILKRLKEDTDNVWPFLNPVPHEVQFYYDAIAFPICLADVEQKVHENKYCNESFFIADLSRMFSNCYLVNGHESPYYEMGYNLNKTFLELCMQHFPGSTLMPHLPERKPNVKKH